MARDRVATALGELEKEARDLRPLPPGESPGLARNAEFRSIVRALIDDLAPRCRLAEAAGDDQILAPARTEMAGFRRRLEGTPYALDLAIADADAQHEQGLIMVECAHPSREAAGVLTKQALRTTREQIARAKVVAGI